MATAPRVDQDNEKTMTREQRTMSWMGRTKGENKEKSKWSNSQPARMSIPRRGTSAGWRRSSRCPALAAS